MMASVWGTTPRASIEAECRRVGTKKFVADCVRILTKGDVNEETLLALAGPSAVEILRSKEGRVSGYWPRTWAVRALL